MTDAGTCDRLSAGRCLALTPYRWVSTDPSSSPWRPEQDPDEPLGTKEKRWLLDGNEHPWLLKYARISGSGVSGEHWAECVVHGLASLIGVPTACVWPALDHGRCAVLSRSVLRKGPDGPETRLEHGSELLGRLFPDYDVTIGDNNTHYTVDNVRRCLADVSGPVADGMNGFAVWAGYVLLDAWVCGCDRHHDNWAVVTNENGDRRLAESFDHGNALGFQVSEQQLVHLSSHDAISDWLSRGRTHFFGRPTPLVVAQQALVENRSEDRAYWLDRLADAHQSDIEAMIEAVPSVFMSAARRSFVLGMLDINRKGILHAISY